MSIKRKKVRYRKYEFKLSDKQKKFIDHFCRIKRISANKLIKMAIRDYIIRNQALLPEDDYVTENQLMLFDFDDETFYGEGNEESEAEGKT
jgi:hypothetical protein